MASEGLDPAGRYYVKKRVDLTGKHDDCRYFVLDPKHDLFARAALEIYADMVRADPQHEKLAVDLDAWIRELEISDGR